MSLGYVGDGSARWPCIHKLDAAISFRIALEKGTARATYHAVAEQGIPTKDIMGVIGKRLGTQVESKPIDEVVASLGQLESLTTMNTPTSSEKTQKQLG